MQVSRYKGNKTDKATRLFMKQKGICKYCGVRCTNGDSSFRFKLNEMAYPHLATIEHIYTKLDMRSKCKGGDKAVMTCYKCNKDRNEKDKFLFKDPHTIPYEIGYPNLLINMLKHNHIP